jgi:uncharacterized protein
MRKARLFCSFLRGGSLQSIALRRVAVHARFALTLMVNHACNLRCTYCYTGEKFRRVMPIAVGQKAIARAVKSLAPGGTLELAFFGGEPLIEAELIGAFIRFAKSQCRAADVGLALNLTTNGTIDSPAAWSVMLIPELNLAISHDGLPATHDRHRVTAKGGPSSARVLSTLAKLRAADKPNRVVMVVTPENVTALPAGLQFLYEQGVRQFDPSLDLWTTWSRGDGESLARVIRHCADFWGERLPDCSLSWFDAKAARLARVPTDETARCGFGHSEIAVAPSGHLFP